MISKQIGVSHSLKVAVIIWASIFRARVNGKPSGRAVGAAMLSIMNECSTRAREGKSVDAKQVLTDVTGGFVFKLVAAVIFLAGSLLALIIKSPVKVVIGVALSYFFYRLLL